MRSFFDRLLEGVEELAFVGGRVQYVASPDRKYYAGPLLVCISGAFKIRQLKGAPRLTKLGDLHKCDHMPHPQPWNHWKETPHVCQIWRVTGEWSAESERHWIKIPEGQSAPPDRAEPSPIARRRALDALEFKPHENPEPAHIRARYLRLIKENHPDQHGGRGEERTREITAAYHLLMKPAATPTTP